MIGTSELVNAMRARREQMIKQDGSDEYVVKAVQATSDTRGPDYVKRRISELGTKIENLGKLDAQLEDLVKQRATQKTIVQKNTTRFGENQTAKKANNEIIRLDANIGRVEKEISSREAKLAEHNADIAELGTLDTDKKIRGFLDSKIKAHTDCLLKDGKTIDDGFYRYDVQTARTVLRDMNDAAAKAAAIPPSIVDIHPIALLADAIERAAQGAVLPSLDQSLSASICASILVSSIKSTTNVDLGDSIYSNNAKDYGGLFAAVQAAKAPASSSSSSSSSSTTDLSESKLNAKNLLIKVLDSNEGKVREFFTTLLKANNSLLIVNLMTNLEAGEIEKAYANAKVLLGIGVPENEFTKNLQDLGISEWYTEQKQAEAKRLADEEAERQRQAEELVRQRLAEARRVADAEQQRQQQLEAQRQAEAKRLADEEAERQRLAEVARMEAADVASRTAAEAERKRQADEAKRIAEAERQRQADEAEAKRKADEESEKHSLQHFFSETLEDENSRNSTIAYNKKLQDSAVNKAHEKLGDDAAKAKRNQMFKIVGATVLCGALVVAGVYLYKNPQALSKASTALNSYCSKAKESSIVKFVKDFCSGICLKIGAGFSR